ncbi:hypothetical protein [Chitinophaga solisilvae]|uniref:hypothetical protein n=1 Tax=Chitinophaga solisilvae TaxID=1233460 RepID=UPI001F3E304F|nr:hypothetical protein [Chitinophaga solisilvae]
MLIISVLACNEAGNNSDEDSTVAVPAASERIAALTEEETDTIVQTKEDLPWEKMEVFHFSKALIDHKVPLFTSEHRFTAALGAADSISTPAYDGICASQFEEEFLFFYKDGSCFEKFSDSLACEEFVLTTGHTITCNGITFSRNTTWAEVKKYYPNAVQQAENEGRTDMVTLRDSDNMNSDSSVRLYFENGKLVRIENFIPC